MTDVDVERIVKMKFSPINISVHTTNPELRVKMMRNKRAGEVLSYLGRIKEAGLSMRGQVVLCNGINDGEELLRTLRDLSAYYPEMDSVSIVPAGLTKYREGLYPLSDFTKEEAESVIDTVEAVATEHFQKHGRRMFFLADELYLKASRDLPSADYYEEYPQIENGVGMMRSFIDEVEIALSLLSDYTKENEIPQRRVTVATGVAMYDVLCAIAKKINGMCPSVEISVRKILNDYFGHTITVSGLLTGTDIVKQLSGTLFCDELLLPTNALREGEDVFLCGMTFSELENALSVKASTAGNDGFEFVEAVLGIERGTL
jgi:putative radical SAM enzyme (TIGR03279 family)